MAGSSTNYLIKSRVAEIPAETLAADSHKGAYWHRSRRCTTVHIAGRARTSQNPTQTKTSQD